MPELYADGLRVSRETVDQAVTRMVPKIVPVIVPKTPEMTEISETFQKISGDIVPNGYKGFGANLRQDWVQEKGANPFRSPLLYPD